MIQSATAAEKSKGTLPIRCRVERSSPRVNGALLEGQPVPALLVLQVVAEEVTGRPSGQGETARPLYRASLHETDSALRLPPAKTLTM